MKLLRFFFGLLALYSARALGLWTYSFQTFSALEVLGAAKMNQIEVNIRDHVHGRSGVSNPTNQFGLTCFLQPSMEDGWRGIYRAGFDWWSRNQQWGGPWGGELLDGATGTLYRTEFATGYIDGNNVYEVGDAAGRTYHSTGFKVAETQTLAATWVKIWKVGNPTNNLGLFIYTDDGFGKPNALHTNGTATAQSGKLHTADTAGQWCRFVFPTPPTLTGGTKYHIVLKSSGAVDSSNFWKWINNTISKYPFGGSCTGDGTPTWSALSGYSSLFLNELSANAQTLQAINGTQFPAMLDFGGSGASGTLSMSRGLCSSVPLKELMDLRQFTLILTGSLFTKDATIIDIGYGLDHDRIVLRANASTGYAQLDVYDSAGAKTTATSSVDVSNSTVHTIGIYVRAINDGADLIDIEVDGVAVSTGNSGIVFDKQFAELGTMWIGGGFALAPTMTQKLAMGVLPSADSPAWTWAGGTEANCVSIQNSRLRQNKNGYGSTDQGNYSKSSLSLSNSNGWHVGTKLRVENDVNVVQSVCARLDIHDGTTRNIVHFHEFFTDIYNNGYEIGPQYNLKLAENVYNIIGKLSDIFHFANHKLLFDGSGKLVGASASNTILFGDQDTTAGYNADITWDYFAYYNTAWLPPQFTSGYITELAIFKGDCRGYTSMLYASGTQIPMRTMFGLGQRYLDKSGKTPSLTKSGATSSPTMTSATPTTVPEMEAFVAGEIIEADFMTVGSTSTTGQSAVPAVYVDGAPMPANTGGVYMVPADADTLPLRAQRSHKTNLGLHKVEGRVNTNGTNTLTFDSTRRNMIIRSRA